MNLIKHALIVLTAIPFLPYLFFQGYYIRKKIPKLIPPEDFEGTSGISPGTEINLLCIGESTIAGVGVDSHKNGIAGQLADYLNQQLNKKINWAVFAKSGITTIKLTEKIKSEKIPMSPDVMVIGTGANDGFRLNNPIFFRKNILSIINSLQSKYPGKPIVFANMPPISIFPAFPFLIKFFVSNVVNGYRHELIKIVEKTDNVFFDLRKIEEMDWGIDDRPMTDFFSDGVHPSKLTYKLWAENVGEFILKNKIIH